VTVLVLDGCVGPATLVCVLLVLLLSVLLPSPHIQVCLALRRPPFPPLVLQIYACALQQRGSVRGDLPVLGNVYGINNDSSPFVNVGVGPVSMLAGPTMFGNCRRQYCCRQVPCLLTGLTPAVHAPGTIQGNALHRTAQPQSDPCCACGSCGVPVLSPVLCPGVCVQCPAWCRVPRSATLLSPGMDATDSTLPLCVCLWCASVVLGVFPCCALGSAVSSMVPCAKKCYFTEPLHRSHWAPEPPLLAC